jgi:hypothetical protein
MEFDDCTFAVAHMILYAHIAMIFNPQLANNDVVNGGGDFLECAHCLAIIELNMGVAGWNDAEVCATETGARLKGR